MRLLLIAAMFLLPGHLCAQKPDQAKPRAAVPDQLKPRTTAVPDQVKVPTTTKAVPDQTTTTYATPDQTTQKTYAPDQVKMPMSTKTPTQKTYATPDQTTQKGGGGYETSGLGSLPVDQLIDLLARLERQRCQPIRNLGRRALRNRIADLIAEKLPPGPPGPRTFYR